MIRRPAFSSRSSRAFAVAAVAAFGLTGCAEMSLQATTLEYDPADGVSAEVGGVTLQDVMLITKTDGKGKGKGDAKLSGLAENPTGGAVKVTVGTSAKGGEEFTVPANSVVRLDGKPGGGSDRTIEPITLKTVQDEPGETTTLAFTSPSGGQIQLAVPVLVDQYPYGDHSPEHPPARGAEGEEGGH